MARILAGFIATSSLLEPETITWVLFLNGEGDPSGGNLSGGVTGA